MADTDLRTKSARNNSNVVRLPTAARRQVAQSVRAARAYRADQPEWPGTYLSPHVREAKYMASNKSPELLILMAIMKVMPKEQRVAAANIVHNVSFFSGDDVSHDASIIMAELAR